MNFKFQISNFKLLGLLAVVVLIGGAGCTMGSGVSRGSDTTLLSIAGEIRFTNKDLGKNVNLRRNQKLIISLKSDPEVYGKWTISGPSPQQLMLRSRGVRGESALNEVWYFEAIGMGYTNITFSYTPYDDTIPPRVYKCPIFVANQQL
jgi:predicted secreted protein